LAQQRVVYRSCLLVRHDGYCRAYCPPTMWRHRWGPRRRLPGVPRALRAACHNLPGALAPDQSLTGRSDTGRGPSLADIQEGSSVTPCRSGAVEGCYRPVRVILKYLCHPDEVSHPRSYHLDRPGGATW